jgi:hypothetical protein
LVFSFLGPLRLIQFWLSKEAYVDRIGALRFKRAENPLAYWAIMSFWFILLIVIWAILFHIFLRLINHLPVIDSNGNIL